MEEEQLNSLMELACLQAYLTWISSGQISCKEDGGHHRPCAAANSAKAVTEALWDLASNGDAELFIARRIFPCLPSFSDEFTCAVPMTRIRDIAHRNDIPKDMKLYIKRPRLKTIMLSTRIFRFCAGCNRCLRHSFVCAEAGLLLRCYMLLLLMNCCSSAGWGWLDHAIMLARVERFWSFFAFHSSERHS